MKSKQLSKILVAISLATAAGCLMLIGSGFFQIRVSLKSFWACYRVAPFSSKWTYYLLLLPINVAYAIYTPVGIKFQ